MIPNSTSLNNQLETPLLAPQTQNLFQNHFRNKLDASFGDLDFFTNEKKDCASAAQFFEEILDTVDLSSLYTFVDTCYYAQRMPYCPIIVENKRRKPEETRYQLQVWTKDGTLIYDKGLNERPLSWCITNEVLVYMPSPADQDNENQKCIWIVKLNNDCCTIKIDIAGIEELEQIVKPHLIFCNKCLYISDKHTIYILNTFQLDHDIIHKIGIEKYYQIQLGNVINHGMTILQTKDDGSGKQPTDVLYIIICCETSDNQLDFAKLSFFPQKFESQKQQREIYQVQQIAEVVRRPHVSNDPIEDFKIVYDSSPDQWPFAITLRKSKQVDFYWNYYLVQNSDIIPYDNQAKFEKIQLNFEAFYLLKSDQTIYSVELNRGGRIGLSEAKKIVNHSSNFDDLFLCRLRLHLNFYQAHCMIGTYFIVSHHRKIFIYDLIKKIWEENFILCDYPVTRIFASHYNNSYHTVAVLLSNGSFNYLQNYENCILKPSNWHLIKDTQQNLKIEGKSINIFEEIGQQHILYLTNLNKDNKLELNCFNGEQVFTYLKEISSDISKSHVMPLMTSAGDTWTLIYHRDALNPQYSNINIVRAKWYRDSKTQVINKLPNWESYPTIQFEDLTMYKDIPHTAVSSKIDDVIFFFGKRNIYKLTVKDREVQVISNVFIVSVQVFDEDYCYAIVQQDCACNYTEVSGIKIFSLKMLQEKGDLLFFDVETTIAGRCNTVNFAKDSQRIIYMKNYSKFHILPPLHRSTINFVGMLPRSRYLAVKKIKNKFHALDKDNIITTWNSLTGKLEKQEIAIGVNYKNYKVYGDFEKNTDFTYMREWYQPITLIMSKSSAKEGIDVEFLSSQIFQHMREIHSSKGYLDQEHNTFCFKNFKIIEIQDDQHVIEHMSFVHHHFNDRKKLQRLILSNDCNIMIEKLLNLRVILYQRKRDSDNKTDKWEVVKRFNEYPHEISDKSQDLYLFSPDLKYFMTNNRKDRNITIKNALQISTQNELQIQFNTSNYMNEDEDIISLIRRIKWVTNDSFLICSSWGFEKLFQVKGKTIIEINSSQIYDFPDIKNSQQIYSDPDVLPLGDVRRRLIRKHQALKRLKRLYPKIDKQQIYNILFSIDYNVGHGRGKFVSDISFSYLQWKLIEDIESGSTDIKIINDEYLDMLCLNILPGQKTILHRLIKKSQDIKHILSRVPIQYEKFEMPFIQDLNNNTPLHYCIKSQDFQTADMIVNYLANAPLDHHSREIIDIIPDLIASNLPSMIQYLNRRMIQTPQIKTITRGALLRYSFSLDAAITPVSIWEDMSKITSQLFLKNDTVKRKAIEADVELKFIDLPEIHLLKQPNTVRFFQALQDCDNLELFELTPIRTIIEYHWPIAKKYTMQKLFWRFIFYLFFFWIYTNFTDNLLELESNDYLWFVWLANICILVYFSFYFLFNEIKQIRSERGSYFRDPWNYIDLTPPFIVLAIAIINTTKIETEWESILKSVGSLAMWLKLLYFCRIYKHTGYLIRTIVKVVQGMTTFLMVLAITVVAVGDAQVSIIAEDRQKLKNADFVDVIIHGVSRFFGSVFQTYKLILGGDMLETTEGLQIFADILSVFATIFVMVVMLNLLISIIGSIFAQVQENQLNEYYQEKASIIAENTYLIPDQVADKEDNRPGSLLLLGAKVGFQIQDAEEDVTQTREEALKEDIMRETESILRRNYDAIKDLIIAGQNAQPRHEPSERQEEESKIQE